MFLLTIQLINIFIFVIIILFFIYASIISFFENEKRAGFRFLLASFILLVFFYTIIIINPFFNAEILIVFDALLIALSIIVFFPIKGNYKIGDDIPKIQFDERDTMFSRKELIPNTDIFNEYYRKNPQNKKPDDEFRKKPGLLSNKASKFEPLTFAVSHANFETVKLLKPAIKRIPNNSYAEIEPAKIQQFISNWSKKLGVHSIGFTKLKDYHFYHTKGRGETYNKSVVLKHKYAVVFTVEMDKEMINTAPDGPTVMESSQQYLNSGVIAIQIANFLRNLGLNADAHIDGNYEVVCPLLARDAGLGEIGRMGLLMTPKLGPRVRIAAVTTNVAFKTNTIVRDNSTIHFCEICKKCADNCPAKAIEFDKRKETENGFRWKINAETCYTYWCITGTDCGKCIRVCPFSHPNNPLHNFIRWGIKNNIIFRHLALKLDDIFYGRKPKNHNLKWQN